MVDLRRFFRLKPKGLCWIEKLDESFVVKFKRFDNETGTDLDPETNYITEDEIRKELAESLEKIEAANIILNQIQLLKANSSE